MRALLKITYILPMPLISLFICGIITHNSGVYVSAIVLLVVDIVVGIWLQRLSDQANPDALSALLSEEETKSSGASFNMTMQDRQKESLEKGDESGTSQHVTNELDAIDNIFDFDEFMVSEDELEELVNLFNKGITDADKLAEKMGWHGKRKMSFIDHIMTTGKYIEINIDDIFDDEHSSMTLRKDKIQELIDNIPIKMDENDCTSEWYGSVCKEINEFIPKIAPKNKVRYSFDDIDLMIGKAFCCIISKPENLCKKVQETFRECAADEYKTKKEFSLKETQDIIKTVFEKIEAEQCEEDGDEEKITDFGEEELLDEDDYLSNVQEDGHEEREPIRNMFGEIINERTFAEMQQLFPGFGDDGMLPMPQEQFDITLQKVLPDYNVKTHNTKDFSDNDLYKSFSSNGITLNDIKLVILSFIFGCYGCKKDIDFAQKMSVVLLKVSESYKPDGKHDILNDSYTLWLSEMAISYILLGTVYAYQNEYVKAAYYFMLCLKTNAINLNMPYCDFINYILGKLDELPVQKANYTGCGFEAENPMGSVAGNRLIAQKSAEIISEMEGLKGEVVVAYAGRTRTYGYLQRIGSTRNQNGQMIDIYETYVIDSDFKLYKVKFFFNGYFSGGLTEAIRIAKGFRLKANSLKNLYYKVLE